MASFLVNALYGGAYPTFEQRVQYPPRIDLVFKDPGGLLSHAYLAKAGYVNDFQPNAIAKMDPYLGTHLSNDVTKLLALRSRLGLQIICAAVFYLYEVSDSSRMTKYRRAPVVVDIALETLQRFVQHGVLVAKEVIDCGDADGANVRIHLCVFDPLPSECGAEQIVWTRAAEACFVTNLVRRRVL